MEQKPRSSDTEADQLPEPSAELVLLRAMLEAHVLSMPRKRAITFLRTVAEALEFHASMASVIKIRPRSQDGEVSRARVEALAWYRQVVSVMLARLG